MNNLDRYHYTISSGPAALMTTIPTYETLSKYFWGKTCIEFGSGDGGGTKILLNYFNCVVAVDGSEKMLKKLQNKIKSLKLKVIHSLVEDLNLDQEFDTVVICHFLEHVEDPVSILKKAKQMAHPNSRILIAVPNAYSLHRQIGVMLGMLKSVYDFGETDKKVGHKRVYDMPKLKKDIRKSGLRIIESGGFLIKCFSNDQLAKVFKNPKDIKAHIKLGEKYPEIAAEIYAVCTI